VERAMRETDQGFRTRHSQRRSAASGMIRPSTSRSSQVRRSSGGGMIKRSQPTTSRQKAVAQLKRNISSGKVRAPR
jgi:hypothetical protein